MAERGFEETQSGSRYIALDSDILRDLAVVNELVKNNGGVIDKDAFRKALKKEGNIILVTNINFVSEVYDMVKRSVSEKYPVFKFLVTETVWRETRYLPIVADFIREYCYVPNINALNMDSKLAEKKKLAEAYCYGLYDSAGKMVCPPPMQKDKKGKKPSNDAYIMAEATREFATLLTMNGQDFVYVKDGAPGNNDRKRGIMDINVRLRYIKTVNGKGLVPEPFTLERFCPLVRYIESGAKLLFSEDADKVRAGELRDI